MIYGVSENNIGRLQRVQNALARVNCGAPYRSSASCNGTSTFITLATHQAAHRLQSGDDDLQGPTTPATTVSLRTCCRLQTFADTAVDREWPAGRAHNHDDDHVACLQLSGNKCLEQPATSIETFWRCVKTFLFDIAYNDHQRSVTFGASDSLHRNKAILRKCSETNGARRFRNKCHFDWLIDWLIQCIRIIISDLRWHYTNVRYYGGRHSELLTREKSW